MLLRRYKRSFNKGIKEEKSVEKESETVVTDLEKEPESKKTAKQEKPAKETTTKKPKTAKK